MKALNLFNAAMLALTATFAVTLGVVWLCYVFYLDLLPRLRGEWRLVSQMTVVFALLTLFAAAAFWGHWRGRAWRWPAEALLLLALVLGGWWMQRILS